jgi:hypothetical protein
MFQNREIFGGVLRTAVTGPNNGPDTRPQGFAAVSNNRPHAGPKSKP